jgi:hypothetical protein
MGSRGELARRECRRLAGARYSAVSRLKLNQMSLRRCVCWSRCPLNDTAGCESIGSGYSDSNRDDRVCMLDRMPAAVVVDLRCRRVSFAVVARSSCVCLDRAVWTAGGQRMDGLRPAKSIPGF